MPAEKGHFNAQREISKYKLDHSTFDLIDVDRFHNTNWSTVFGYMWVWILVFLSWILMGIDIYTCLNILVFHRWSTDDYKPYAYSVAKWIFTGCIIFQFVLIVYHWIWAIHTYRTKNIALVYVNFIAKTWYSIRSYNYYCLFHKIERDNFFEWACFLTYNELDNALQVLVADTPRQVINILTLRYYATDGSESNDIIANIREIATTNITLSVILSFMCVSVIIWSIFFFRFCLGMLFYLPVYAKLRKRGYKSLKKYCCDSVSNSVRQLVLKHHKPKNELLEKGILDSNEIKMNPLLNNSSTATSLNKKIDDDFAYRAADSFRKPTSLRNDSYSMQDLKNPFIDGNKVSSKDSLMSDSEETKVTKPHRSLNRYENQYPPLDENYRSNPFNDSQASLLNNQATFGYSSNPNLPNSLPNFDRKQSLSSLTYNNASLPPTVPQKAQTQPTSNYPYGLPRQQTQLQIPSIAAPTPIDKSIRKKPPAFNPFEDTSTDSYANDSFDFDHKNPYNLESDDSDNDSDNDSDEIDKDDLDPYSATPYPVERSETEQDTSSAPYPVRGISIYDKKRKDHSKGSSLPEVKENDERGIYPVASNELVNLEEQNSEYDSEQGSGQDSEQNSEQKSEQDSGYPILDEYADESESSDNDDRNHRGYPV